LWYGVKDIANELFIFGTEKNTNNLRPNEFWALRDVSFELKRGESLAILGANGAGKSTLLKSLYGLIRPDSGYINIRGNLNALIELGAGLDPVLTGRENIYLRASLTGLKRFQVEPLTESIITFAGLEEFIDAPVQFYSSGMMARLAYSITVHLSSDILLVDEVIAVGDLEFQRKCIDNMRDYLSKGGSIVLVSHTPYHIQSVCKRGILLDKGELIFEGTANEVLDKYFQNMHRRELSQHTKQDNTLSKERPLVIESVLLKPVEGDKIETEKDAVLTINYRALNRIENVAWGFNFWTYNDDVCIAGNGNGIPQTLNAGAGKLSCLIPKFPLLPGTYLIKGAISNLISTQVLATFGLEDAPIEFTVKATPDTKIIALRAFNQLMMLDIVWL